MSDPPPFFLQTNKGSEENEFVLFVFGMCPYTTCEPVPCDCLAETRGPFLGVVSIGSAPQRGGVVCGCVSSVRWMQLVEVRGTCDFPS